MIYKDFLDSINVIKKRKLNDLRLVGYFLYMLFYSFF